MNLALNVIYHNRHFIRRSITCSLQHKCSNEKNWILHPCICYFLSTSLQNRARETKRETPRSLASAYRVRKRHKINTRRHFCWKREDTQSKRRTEPTRPDVISHSINTGWRIDEHLRLTTRNRPCALSCSPREKEKKKILFLMFA